MDCRLYRKSIAFWFLAFGLWLLAPQNTYSQQSTTDSPNWRDSLTVLNKLIAISPWSTDLHLRKAAVNLELKQWEYAIDEYALVLQHEPKNPAALFYRAYANTHLRRFDLARNDLSDLLAFLPRHFEARLSLAVVLQQLGRKMDALDELNQTIEIHGDSAVAYAARANLERQMKMDDAALYDWERAEQLAPKDPTYVVSHVDLLLVLERREEARRVLDAAVKRGLPKGMFLEWYEKCKR
jgi:tetratricopeptide (TPR) repeat protein